MAIIRNGTINSDTILGDILNAEHIYGYDGNDILSGYAGDWLYGGLADDKLTALANGVTLIGAVGNDTLYGGSWGTNLFGGVGNDILYGGGNDVMNGGLGADQFIASAGSNVMVDFSQVNEKGNLPMAGITVNLATGTTSEGDTLFNINAVITTHLADKVIGSSTKDWIALGDGNDYAIGGEGDDYIGGGSGNDQTYGGIGNDYLDGDAGNDILNGGAGNDSINGGEGTNTLIGGDGNDILFINNISDTINGGNGNDTLNFVYFSSDYMSNDTLSINLSTGENSLGVVFSSIENIDAFSEETNVALTGNGAANILIGSSTHSSILQGMGGNDTLTGGELSDTIYGGDGNDNLNAGGGSGANLGPNATGIETLFGGAGNDIFSLKGMNPGDPVEMEAIYTGGTGADTFIIDSQYNDVIITITDFSVASGDVIRFENFNTGINIYFAGDEFVPADFAYVLENATQSGNDVVISGFTFSNAFGTQLIIENVQLSQLTSNDFVFLG